MKLQHSVVAGSQLSLTSLKNWLCSWLAMIGQRAWNYTNVILTLSATKAEKLVVNTCGTYFSLAKFELINLLDNLIATETTVAAVLYTNLCGLTAEKLTIHIITLRYLTWSVLQLYKKDPLRQTSCFQQHRQKFSYRPMHFLLGKLFTLTERDRVVCDN